MSATTLRVPCTDSSSSRRLFHTCDVYSVRCQSHLGAVGNLVRNQSQRPNVGLETQVRLVRNPLWGLVPIRESHTVLGRDGAAELPHRVGLEVERPQVRELRSFAVVEEQNVAGLDVAMDDLQVVQELDGIRDHGHPAQSPLFHVFLPFLPPRVLDPLPKGWNALPVQDDVERALWRKL
eukprot:3607190-Rhodomonas_salina.1